MTANWKLIAGYLAARLANHAFCEQHPASRPVKDCPWCRDRAAYDLYLNAGGHDYRDPPSSGPVISVTDLAREARPQ